jgi:WD40 repeat protein
MNILIKNILFSLAILGLTACQNSNNITPLQKGLSSTSKEIEKRTPLVVVGGELKYDLKNHVQSRYQLYGIKMNPQNNTLIAYGDSSQITIYNSNLEYIGGVKSKNDEIKAIDISSDGTYLASTGDDGVIEIWNLDTYQLLHRMKNGSDTLAIAFSADGSKIATGGENKVIEVWNANVGEQIAQLEGHTDDITQLSFIDNDRKIVSSAEDKSVKIWDVTKKQELYSYLAPSNKYGEIKESKSFDDYTVIALTEVQRATGNRRNRNGPPVWDYTIKFKDNQGNILYEFNEHRGPITDIAVAPSRNYMASISEDKTVRLWDLEKRKRITNIVLKEKGTAVSINKSGHLLALVEGTKTIKLYSIANAHSPQTSTNTTPSTTASTGSNPSLYRKQHAIVIGVNTYKKLSLPRLNNAVQDARSVAKVLRDKGFSVIELYNENATKERILDALKELKQHAISNDSTLFYFAGHGDGVSGNNNVREGYILPYEFNSELNNPNPDVMYYDKSAISISSLIMYARDTKAKHIGIILDSCFSGLAMESKYAKKSLSGSDSTSIDQVTYDAPTRSVRIKPATVNNNSTNNIYQDLLNKKSINILTAGDDQPVSDGSNHSPFTQGLLTALSSNGNQSGYIRFTTLAEYIKRYVKEKTNNKQTPQYKNDSLEKGDFIFKVN